MFRKHKLVWFSVAIVVMMLASMGANVVMAKTVLKPTSEDGVVSGAYNRQSGALRLVNGEEDLKASEEFIQWRNLQGDEAAEQEIKDGICVMCEALGLVEDAPGFCFKIKQVLTIHRMLNIFTALFAYYTENGQYPSLLSELDLQPPEAIYDGWGNLFDYRCDELGQNFTLTSLGYDGEEGPDPPEPWYLGDAGECDIIIGNGGWLQKPIN